MCAQRRGAAWQPSPFRAHFHPPRPHLPGIIASPGALETAPGSDPDASALPPTDGRMERWTWRGLLCAGRTVPLRSLDLGRPRCRDRWGNLGRAALRQRGVRGPLLLSGRTCARFLICPTRAGPLPAHQSPREDFRKRISALRPRPAGSREERAPRKFRGLAAGALRGPCLPGGRGGAPAGAGRGRR